MSHNIEHRAPTPLSSRAAPLSSLFLALLLGACGGGGSDPANPPSSPPTSPPASPPTSPPAAAPIAMQCIATVPAVRIDTGGSQLDLSTPAVAELTGLSAPSMIVMQNLTTAGSFLVTPYDLDASNDCVASTSAITVAAGDSETLTLASLPSGMRHFVNLQALTPTILQLCAQSGSTAGDCEPSAETIYGSVQDANKQAVTSAKVTVANNGTVIATTTDAQGNFVIKTDAGTLPGAFSATVSKPGFVPLALSLTKPTTGTRIAVPIQQMTPVGTDYAVVEVEPTVHHLGDGNFSGSVNSGFQFPNAEGATFTRVFAVQAPAVAKPTATITFVAKGVQCSDQVTVNGGLAFVMGNSDPSGEYSSYSVALPPSLFVAGDNTLSISSKVCSGTDLDDFEFQNVVIHFQ